MKIEIFPLAIAILMVGTMIAGCESAAKKEAAADEQLRETRQDLKEKLVAQKLTNTEEWRMFKSDVYEEIARNENRIAELKIQLKKPGKTQEETYARIIDALEQQNKDLSARMVTFEQNQSDWDSFKRKFIQDMDELGRSLNDLTVSN